MNDDQRIDEWIRTEAQQQYHAPPATPRDQIWSGLQARRAAHRVQSPHVLPFRPRVTPTRVTAWAAGIAAVLALGLGLGWVMFGPDTGSPVPVEAAGSRAPNARSVAVTLATVQHLSQVETFLTGFRTAPDQAEVGRFNGSARDLLTSTRLLLDVPGLDPKLKGLLQDLEQVLVQIAQLGPIHPETDLEIIADGLEHRQVMPRLRNAIPAGGALRTLGEI